jgi:hypothetical protein
MKTAIFIYFNSSIHTSIHLFREKAHKHFVLQVLNSLVAKITWDDTHIFRFQSWWTAGRQKTENDWAARHLPQVTQATNH